MLVTSVQLSHFGRNQKWMRSKPYMVYRHFHWSTVWNVLIKMWIIWRMASVECEMIRNWFIGLNIFSHSAGYVIWNSPQWNMMRCSTPMNFSMLGKWLINACLNMQITIAWKWIYFGICDRIFEFVVTSTRFIFSLCVCLFQTPTIIIKQTSSISYHIQIML